LTSYSNLNLWIFLCIRVPMSLSIFWVDLLQGNMKFRRKCLHNTTNSVLQKTQYSRENIVDGLSWCATSLPKKYHLTA
jgi:hypothetical protein